MGSQSVPVLASKVGGLTVHPTQHIRAQHPLWGDVLPLTPDAEGGALLSLPATR